MGGLVAIVVVAVVDGKWAFEQVVSVVVVTVVVAVAVVAADVATKSSHWVSYWPCQTFHLFAEKSC